MLARPNTHVLPAWQLPTSFQSQLLHYIVSPPSGSGLTSSSRSLAAVNPSANVEEAEPFRNFISRNHGLACTRHGVGARGCGLKSVFGSRLVGEALNHEERNKHCEYQNNCHGLILLSSRLSSFLDER
jgi:hypothetical protein